MDGNLYKSRANVVQVLADSCTRVERFLYKKMVCMKGKKNVPAK